MALADVVNAFLRLRDQLPELLGEEQWNAIHATVARQFEKLEGATTLQDQQASIADLVDTLFPYPALRMPLRSALRAGLGTTRGGGSESASARGGRPDATGGDVGTTGGGREEPGPIRGRPEAGGATDTVLERWPHVDLDRLEPVPPTAVFRVTVYVDTTPPREGETSDALDLPDLPEIHLRVVLVTSNHFVIEGDSRGWITVTAGDERSTAAEFRLRVVEGARGAGVIAAFLTFDGRPAGSVHRLVTVTAGAAAEPWARLLPPSQMRADLSARRPDLTVEVAAIPGSGGARFACTVSTPHMHEYADGTTEEWDLPHGTTTKTLVLGRMKGFIRAGATNEARRAALVGAGLDLFEAAPQNFRRTYWALRDAQLPLDSIFVVSSEPYVPWELMIPNRDDEEDDVPIGVSSAVGRWVNETHVSPRQPLELTSSYVIAPTYVGEDRLVFSPNEARLVCDWFNGRQITPALWAEIERVLGVGDASLLHLICHGVDDPDGGEQVIKLEPDEVLTVGMLRGMRGLKRAVHAAKPMIFINACEVGRQAPALVGTGGFAARFIKLGARAVVAPIWSVKDDVASQVARLFYEEIKAHPGRPFAVIMREIRRRAYDGPDPEDSWAAYCFYGDPLAASQR